MRLLLILLLFREWNLIVHFCSIFSIVLDADGGVYTFGTGALGHGNNLRQDYPMKILDFGT